MIRKIQAGSFSLLLILVSGQNLLPQAQALPAHPLMLGEAIDYALAHYPGVTLFHCHRQLHMDFGFMIPFGYM
jgi:FtsP/CotA-like multicopper oxidase with cupredoxin domain